MDAFPPPSSAGSGSAAIVHAQYDVSKLGEHAMPQSVPSRPGIPHDLHRRLAVHVEQRGVLLGRVEVGREEAVRVQFHPRFVLVVVVVAFGGGIDRDAEKVRPGHVRYGFQRVPHPFVVGQRQPYRMIGQSYYAGRLGTFEGGSDVYGVFGIGRQYVRVGAAHGGGSDPLHREGTAVAAAQRGAVQVSTEGIVRGGYEVRPAAGGTLLVHAGDAAHVVGRGGQRRRLGPVGIVLSSVRPLDQVQLPPSAAFAQPQKLSSVLPDPPNRTLKIDPSFVSVREGDLGLARVNVAEV
mmetsp:Transcript_3350/g.8674  ORF Transcript_3350/g.8674 Transcript_3350/m.8674 type:complete len:293 (+) Transcript_3350:706-1584(+)